MNTFTDSDPVNHLLMVSFVLTLAFNMALIVVFCARPIATFFASLFNRNSLS